MARWIFLGCILCTALVAKTQIVNVEGRRMAADTTGWQGSLGLSFTYLKNVQEVLSANASTHVQHKRPKDLYLLVANYNLLRGNNQKLTDNMFYHLRYNRTLSPRTAWEVFSQWQQDVISNINARFLTGTGPRFTLKDTEKLKLFAGTAVMYEYEEEKTEPLVVHNDWRSSNYIAVTFSPNEILQLVNTSFYQPLFARPGDFRFLNQSSLNIKASKKLAIVLNWNYLYDAAPAAGSPLINFAVTNGFTYRL